MNNNKTIIAVYNTPELFHTEALRYYRPLPAKAPTDVNKQNFYALCWNYAVYNALRYDVLAGYKTRTLSKLFQEMALDFLYIWRKDKMWLEIEGKIVGLFSMFQWTDNNLDTYRDNKKIATFGKQSEESKTSPMLNTSGDGKSSVDWGELNKTIMKGFYQDGKFSPNVESDVGDGWKHTKIQHREQKNQQIARIITAMMELQVYFTAYVEKYRSKYTWRWSVMPGTSVIDYATGKMRYISPPASEEEEFDETGRPKPKARPDLDDISPEVWLQKLEQGEAVEKTHYLEYLARQKKRILSTIKSKNMAAQEQANRNVRAIDKMMKGFSRPPYISTLDNYDKAMSKIEGFKIFKSELRLRLELMWDDRAKGIETVMKPFCLLGKPGVGKTEIVKTLAKAWRRPLTIISMGGATDTKDIEGTPPTFQSANWSRLLEGMSMVNADIVVELDELKEELADYEVLKNKTEFQEQEIKELKELIEDMEEKHETSRKIDANSKAPIVLFDEAEKVSNSSVLDALGKVLDTNANTQHWDKFFEGYLNLKYCVVFLTMNWEERCPRFVKDRCDMIDIELLTYQQRINILGIFARRLIRKSWPIMAGKKPDLSANRKNENDDTLTFKQQELANKIGDRILEACIAETWGVRQSIINLEKVIDLMRIADMDGKLAYLNSLDNWNWDSDRDGYDDEVSEKTRTLKYHALTDASGNMRPLQLVKVIHQDFIPKKKDKQWEKIQTVKNTIPGWPGYTPATDEFFNTQSEPGPETTGAFTDAHEREIERLKKEMERMKKHCRDMLADRDRTTEQQRVLLEDTLNELENSKGSAQQLQNKVDELTRKLRNVSVKPSVSMETQTDPTIDTMIIHNVPNSGELRFGGTSNFQKSVLVLKFDKEEGKKIRKLRITNCQNLIQLDLSNLIHLEKLSLRNSKWDNIKGAKNIIPEWKLVVKNCQDVSLDWLEGTNIGVVEIDKPSNNYQ